MFGVYCKTRDAYEIKNQRNINKNSILFFSILMLWTSIILFNDY